MTFFGPVLLSLWVLFPGLLESVFLCFFLVAFLFGRLALGTSWESDVDFRVVGVCDLVPLGVVSGPFLSVFSC